MASLFPSIWSQDIIYSRIYKIPPRSFNLADEDEHFNKIASITWDTSYLELPKAAAKLIVELPSEEEEPIKLRTYLAYLPFKIDPIETTKLSRVDRDNYLKIITEPDQPEDK